MEGNIVMEENITNEIQQAVDIISQYASKNWSEMGVNFSLNEKVIDAYITVDDDEYSIGFDDDDNEKLTSLFLLISAKHEEICEYISLEFDNEGNYTISFE